MYQMNLTVTDESDCNVDVSDELEGVMDTSDYKDTSGESCSIPK